MKRIYQVTALAGTILAGAGGLAFAAADHDGMRGDKGRPGHHQMHKGGHGGGHGYHKVGYHKGGFGPGFSMRHMDGSLAFLKAELKITEAQEPQWQKVDAAIRSAADRMQSLRPDRGERGPRAEGAERGPRAEGAERGPRAERPERPQLNPVERLERMEKMATAASESAREVRTALAPLYETMSDDQKETADKLLRRMPFRR